MNRANVVRVLLPGLLAEAFGAPRQLQVPAGRLGEMLARLDQAYPGIRARLAEDGGRIRRHVNLYLDGEHVRDAGADLPLPAGSEVRFVASIAGG